MATKTLNLVSTLACMALAALLTSQGAASAQEADQSKAPVHHMAPPAGSAASSADAPAIQSSGSDALAHQGAANVKAPVHNISPPSQ